MNSELKDNSKKGTYGEKLAEIFVKINNLGEKVKRNDKRKIGYSVCESDVVILSAEGDIKEIYEVKTRKSLDTSNINEMYGKYRKIEAKKHMVLIQGKKCTGIEKKAIEDLDDPITIIKFMQDKITFQDKSAMVSHCFKFKSIKKISSGKEEFNDLFAVINGKKKKVSNNIFTNLNAEKIFYEDNPIVEQRKFIKDIVNSKSFILPISYKELMHYFNVLCNAEGMEEYFTDADDEALECKVNEVKTIKFCDEDTFEFEIDVEYIPVELKYDFFAKIYKNDEYVDFLIASEKLVLMCSTKGLILDPEYFEDLKGEYNIVLGGTDFNTSEMIEWIENVQECEINHLGIATLISTREGCFGNKAYDIQFYGKKRDDDHNLSK